MNTIFSRYGKALPWAIAGVAVIGLIVVMARSGGPSAPAPLTPEGGEVVVPAGDGAEVAASTSDSGATVSGGAKPVPAPKGTPVSSVKLLTPAAGDVWAMDKTHTVNWVRPSGYYTATAILVDAGTKKDVGWLISNISAHQTGFSWDGRSVSTTRSGGIRKEIQPGTYSIRVVSDGKDPTMVSGAFTIAAVGASESMTPIFRFKDFTITPAEITVARGAKIIFVNNDAKAHTISADKFGPYLIPAMSAYTLDTAPLDPGNYFYTSNLYTYRARGTVIVK